MPDGILRSGYEALGRGDAGPLLGLLGDDFEWVEPEETFRGAQGFETGVLEPLAGIVFELDEVVSAGSREVVTGVMRGSGVELPFAHVWALAEDGRPVSARAYFDRSRLAVAASRRQLAEVAEDLMEQAAEIRRQWSRLGDALRAAGLEEAAAEASEAAEYVNGAGGESSALLVAVDMAQEGSTREEVDAYLRDELGVEDTSELLDEVFSSAEGAAPGSADQAGVVDASRLTRLFARNRG